MAEPRQRQAAGAFTQLIAFHQLGFGHQRSRHHATGQNVAADRMVSTFA